jgi:hypothetical protein
MGTAATKRVLPHKGYVIRRDGTRAPVLIMAQSTEYVWITVNTPTRLPGGRMLKAGETACLWRGHVRLNQG